MKRIPMSLRSLFAMVAIVLHLGSTWLHALSHEDDHDSAAISCKDLQSGHWHQDTGHQHPVPHACVECQRGGSKGLEPVLSRAVPTTVSLPVFGPDGPLELHYSRYFPAAPRRGPPQA